MEYTERSIVVLVENILNILYQHEQNSIRNKNKKSQGLSIYYLSKSLNQNIDVIQKIIAIFLNKGIIAINTKYLVDWVKHIHAINSELDIDNATIYAITEYGKKILKDDLNLGDSFFISYDIFKNKNKIAFYYYPILTALENEYTKQPKNKQGYYIKVAHSIKNIIGRYQPVSSNGELEEKVDRLCTMLVSDKDRKMVRKSTNLSGGNKINKLYFTIPLDRNINSDYKLVINENYLTYLEVSRHQKSWNFIIQIAESENNPTIPIKDEENKNKGYLDYFNSNKNNKLYQESGYNITKLLRVKNGYVIPEKGIIIKTISNKQFATNYNQQKAVENGIK